MTPHVPTGIHTASTEESKGCTELYSFPHFPRTKRHLRAKTHLNKEMAQLIQFHTMFFLQKDLIQENFSLGLIRQIGMVMSRMSARLTDHDAASSCKSQRLSDPQDLPVTD